MTSASSPSLAQSMKEWKGLLAALLYGFVSISITFFNKAVLGSYAFHYPNTMSLFQMLCSLVFLSTMKGVSMISYPPFNMRTAIKSFPLTISFVGMVLTGLGALNYLNVPMFNSLRRVTTLITMYGEMALMGSKESTAVALSVYGMVLGAVIAGIYDLSYNFTGYVLVALNCFFTAAYLLYIAKFGKQGLDTFGLMFYNNLTSLPFVFLICLIGGDFASDAVPAYEYLFHWDFLFCFIFQSGLAFLLNYSIFLCTNLNSALTTSVTGQIKNIATTAIGYFLFGDVKYNFINVVGLVVGVITSCWYSWLKFEEAETAKKKKNLEKDAQLGVASSAVEEDPDNTKKSKV